MGASRPETSELHRTAPTAATGIRILAAVVVATAFPPVAQALDAQQEATPVLAGRVEKGGVSVPDATVVLHRVTAEAAGEIDSVRVDTAGHFSFELPSVPDPGGRGEVYFASVRYAGVLYFGAPIHQAVQLDSLYTLDVYDTVAAPGGGADLAVAVRYIVARPIEGGWEVADLFEIANAGTRTLVPIEDGEPVWSYPLPAGIRDPTVGEGDVSPEASSIADGSVHVTAPIPPGQRRLVLRYFLDALDLTVPLPGSTVQMELLVREPAPPLEVTGLVPAESIPMGQGVTYRRYTGADFLDAAVAVVPGADTDGLPARNVAVMLALVLALGGLWAYLRGSPGARASTDGSVVLKSRAASVGPAGPERGSASPSRRSLLLEIALIDQALEDRGTGPGEVSDLRRRRSVLVRRLEDFG